MATNLGSVMTLANGIIGVSILAMPFCFKQCGIILSIIMLLISNIISRLTCHFLLKSAIMTRRRTFEFLAFHAFGPSGKFFVEIGIIGFLLGTCIAYFVVIGDLGPAFIANILNLGPPTETLRSTVIITLALFCVLPLGLLRNVDSLSSVCTATIGFYVCLIVKIIIEALPHLLFGDWVIKVIFWRPIGILQCLPIFSMALCCQTQLFEIFDVQSNVSLDSMNSVIRGAINICTAVYIFVGLFGYIAFCAKQFSGNILMSFTPSLATDVIKVGFVLSLAFSFPLVIFPCRASLHSLLFKKAQIPHEYVSTYIPEHRFKWITMIIVGISFVTGLLIPSIELVLGLVGSTIGVMICVIFPSTCFICITTKNTTERILSQIILVVGILIMVLGTYANLYAIEEASVAVTSMPKIDPMIPHLNNIDLNDILKTDLLKNQIDQVKEIDRNVPDSILGDIKNKLERNKISYGKNRTFDAEKIKEQNYMENNIIKNEIKESIIQSKQILRPESDKQQSPQPVDSVDTRQQPPQPVEPIDIIQQPPQPVEPIDRQQQPPQPVETIHGQQQPPQPVESIDKQQLDNNKDELLQSLVLNDGKQQPLRSVQINDKQQQPPQPMELNKEEQKLPQPVVLNDIHQQPPHPMKINHIEQQPIVPNIKHQIPLESAKSNNDEQQKLPQIELHNLLQSSNLEQPNNEQQKLQLVENNKDSMIQSPQINNELNVLEQKPNKQKENSIELRNTKKENKNDFTKKENKNDNQEPKKEEVDQDAIKKEDREIAEEAKNNQQSTYNPAQELIEKLKAQGKEQEEVLREAKQVLAEIKEQKEELVRKQQIDDLEKKQAALEIRKIADLAIEKLAKNSNDELINKAKSDSETQNKIKSENLLNIKNEDRNFNLLPTENIKTNEIEGRKGLIRDPLLPIPLAKTNAMNILEKSNKNKNTNLDNEILKLNIVDIKEDKKINIAEAPLKDHINDVNSNIEFQQLKNDPTIKHIDSQIKNLEKSQNDIKNKPDSNNQNNQMSNGKKMSENIPKRDILSDSQILSRDTTKNIQIGDHTRLENVPKDDILMKNQIIENVERIKRDITQNVESHCDLCAERQHFTPDILKEAK